MKGRSHVQSSVRASMLMMRTPLKGRGFTIVEVMVVLAVTLIIFGSTILLIEGQQQKTEFTAAINTIQASTQQLMNTVSNGSYNTDPTNGKNLWCAGMGTTGTDYQVPSSYTFKFGPGNLDVTAIQTGPTPATADTNINSQFGLCELMGKALQFTSDSTGDFTSYDVAALPMDAERVFPLDNDTPVWGIGGALYQDCATAVQGGWGGNGRSKNFLPPQDSTSTYCESEPVAVVPLPADCGGPPIYGYFDGNTSCNPGFGASAPPNTAEPGQLENGLTVKWMQYSKTSGTTCTGGASCNSIGTILFLADPSPDGNDAAYNLEGGAQTVNLIPVETSDLTDNESQATLEINDAWRYADADKNPAGGVQICFVSGGTDQSGILTLGSNGRTITTKLNLYSDKTCA